jgi:hypothetical protein
MQLAYLEPRRLQSPRPLPLCPRPFPGEAVDSWIWRIGREFGYTPAKFLRAIGRPSLDPKGPGPVLTKADVSYFATLARLPPNELMAMETIPAPWRLRAVRDQSFCARCWLEDQRLHGFTYVRGSWMHAGRISCDRHGSWLYSVRERLGSKHCDLAHRAAHGIPAEAIEAIITDEANLERNPRCSWIPEAGACLKSLEAAVVGATAGRSPPEEEWGPIGAREFLNVVHDVTTWSLQNFEDFRAPCPANVHYVDWAPFLPPLFRFSCATLPPWSESQPERSLRLRVDPDERRNALWMAHGLLATVQPPIPHTGPGFDRRARQRRILRGQNPASLSWLVARMQRWPDAYREACWVSWEEMLLPCYSHPAGVVS